MPRLSIFKPEKGNDYKFLDRNIFEMFQVGGTDAFIHKYLGPQDQGNQNDATQPNYVGKTTETTIQDLLFLENRDRKYSEDVFTARCIYNVQDIDFDLTQFGLFLQNDQLFMTVHLNDTVERIGRKIMAGDVIELPHLKDDFSLQSTDINDNTIDQALKRFYVVEDVSRAAEGFSQTWWPHLLRVKTKPIMDSQEYRDIFGDKDDPNAYGRVGSTYDRDKEINEAIITQAEANVPKSGYDTTNYFVLPTDETGKVALVTGDNVDLLASSNIGSDTVYEAAKSNGYIEGYLTGDGIAANGNSAGFGTAFPTYPVKDQLFLRTDYVPQRLFKFDGKRFVKVEDNVRLTMSNKTDRTGGKFGFINNTTETTRKDGTTYKERQSLSEIMQPREDN